MVLYLTVNRIITPGCSEALSSTDKQKLKKYLSTAKANEINETIIILHG